jgi:hypothetical protein
VSRSFRAFCLNLFLQKQDVIKNKLLTIKYLRLSQAHSLPGDQFELKQLKELAGLN